MKHCEVCGRCGERAVEEHSQIHPRFTYAVIRRAYCSSCGTVGRAKYVQSATMPHLAWTSLYNEARNLMYG